MSINKTGEVVANKRTVSAISTLLEIKPNKVSLTRLSEYFQDITRGGTDG